MDIVFPRNSWKGLEGRNPIETSLVASLIPEQLGRWKGLEGRNPIETKSPSREIDAEPLVGKA